MVETFKELIKRVDPEKVKKFYLDENNSMEATINKFNISKSLFPKYIKYFGLGKHSNNVYPKKPETKYNKFIGRVSVDDIIDYYITNNHSVEECLEYFNTSFKIFSKFLKNHNITKSHKLVAEVRKRTKEQLYGDPNYNNCVKMQQTCLEKYNSTSPLGCKEIWERTYFSTVEKYGGTGFQLFDSEKRTAVAIKAAKEVWRKCIEDPSYKAHMLEAEYLTKKKNGTFNFSLPEELLYRKLVNEFGADNIKRNYNEDPRYPFRCDFYIVQLDIFIELNLHPSHGIAPFRSNNPDDIALKERLIAKGDQWSKNIVDVWSGRDVLKYNTMIKNNLNYILIYKDEVITNCEDKYKI